MTKKCKECKKKPAAVNYYRKGKTYYRSCCKGCIERKQNDQKLSVSLLKKSGYKKKTRCDRCGFNSKTPEQVSIYYLDGNNLNTSLANLRSFCANCIIELRHKPSNHGDLLADF